MSDTRLIMARHGQTDYNAQGRLQGQVDIPLNATGREQARLLAQAMQNDPPDVIMASPLGRALVTAQTVGKACGAPVSTDERLIERGFGPWEGLPVHEIEAEWPDEWAADRARLDIDLPGVEKRAVVAERIVEVCMHLMGRYEGRTVMVVGHGAATSLGMAAMMGMEAPVYRGLGGLGNCHRSVLAPVTAEDRVEAMRLLSHNLPPDFA